MVTTYRINDKVQPTTLSITRDKKVVIEKSFKSLKQCLAWLHTNSKTNHTQSMVLELLSFKQFILNSEFKFRKVTKA